MAWIELTADHVRSAMSAPELAAYQSAAAGAGQDPLADIIRTAVNEARAHIADCRANKLAAGLTVPERVIHHIVAIIRFRMLTRVDGEVSEDRRTEYRTAVQFFQRVSECRVQIEQPEGETDESGGAQAIDVVSSHGRISTRETLGGL